jgi:hypothetical protein
MKKGIWLSIYMRGFLLWIVLNWTVFLVIDSLLVNSHKVREIYLYKYLVLSVLFYLLSLNLNLCKKIFNLKNIFTDEQLRYLLVQSTIWCGVFFIYMVLVYGFCSDMTLVNSVMFGPIPLFTLFSLVMTYRLQKF